MKKIILLLAISFSILGFSQYNLPTVSPRQMIEQQFSLSKITVDYGRPAVKGRKIFGDLVPFNKVWRAGANAATKITFAQNVNFGGKELMAGTYGLFIIPMEKEWKVIINKDALQWGAYNFDEKMNVIDVNIPVTKTVAKEEWFKIELNPVDSNALDLVFSWDYATASVLIKESNPEAINKIVDKLKEIKSIEKEAASKK